MSSRIPDIEKGESGLGIHDVQDEIDKTTTSVPRTPSSQANTLIGSNSGFSDSRQGSVGTPKGFWSRCGAPFRKQPPPLSTPSMSSAPTSPEEDEPRSSTDSWGEEGDCVVQIDQTDESVVRQIDTEPKGDARFAAFLDSDENFMMYRRFGWVHSRLLLHRQDEISRLELELETMEQTEADNDPMPADRPATRRDYSDSKRNLLDRLEVACNRYSQLLANASALVGMNKPTTGEQRSVLHWLKNEKTIASGDWHFVRCREDLVTLRPGREHAWLDTGVEKLLNNCGMRAVRRLFQSRDTRAKTDDRHIVLYTRSRIDNFVVSIITIMVLALLVVPVWILWKLSETDSANAAAAGHAQLECIGVLLVATLAFSACISLFTRAKRHEILAASAAYCAVLVVFFGNLGQQSGPVSTPLSSLVGLA